SHRALSEHKTLSISWSHYPLFDELTAIKNGRVSEPVKAMYRCLSRSLIKLQYNVHLRNVIYIVFFL
ncbi:hypothetical protein M3I72_02405, partial [Escherichia coli]|nr:hypothetical protein [Escherichia coli]